MPYQKYYVKALKELNKVNQIDYKDRVLTEPMYNIIRAQSNPEKIDELIRSQFLNRYVTEAAKVEKKRQEMMLLSKLNPNKKKLVEEAKKINNPATFAFNLMDIMQHAANGMAFLERKQATYQSVPFFGFSADQMVELMQKQVNSYSYKEGRKFELFKAYGVLDKRFINEAKELEDLVKDNKNYGIASVDERAKMHKTLLTKKLMQEELDSHIFLWKWFHGKEVKAMEEYIKTADDLLKKLDVPGENEEHFSRDEMDALANGGYAMSDPDQKASLEKIFANAKNKANEKISKADLTQRNAAMQKIEDQKREKERIVEEDRIRKQQEKEEKEKVAHETAVKNAERKQLNQDKSNLQESISKKETAEKKALEKDASIKEKIAAAQAKPLPERLFDPYYRTSSDPVEFEKEKSACKEWEEKVGKLDEKTKRVFSANTMKVGRMSAFNKKEFRNEMVRETEANDLVTFAYEDEARLMKKLEGNYKAPTTSELLETMELKNKLATDIASNNNERKEPPKTEKDQKVKTIEEITNNK